MNFFIVLTLYWGSCFAHSFYKIYDNQKYDNFRGIVLNDPILPIATNESVIFGIFGNNFTFTEIGSKHLTSFVIGHGKLTVFKFIQKHSVIVCNDYDCCQFVAVIIKEIKIKDPAKMNMVAEVSADIIYEYATARTNVSQNSKHLNVAPMFSDVELYELPKNDGAENIEHSDTTITADEVDFCELPVNDGVLKIPLLSNDEKN